MPQDHKFGLFTDGFVLSSRCSASVSLCSSANSSTEKEFPEPLERSRCGVVYCIAPGVRMPLWEIGVVEHNRMRTSRGSTRWFQYLYTLWALRLLLRRPQYSVCTTRLQRRSDMSCSLYRPTAPANDDLDASLYIL